MYPKPNPEPSVPEPTNVPTVPVRGLEENLNLQPGRSYSKPRSKNSGNQKTTLPSEQHGKKRPLLKATTSTNSTMPKTFKLSKVYTCDLCQDKFLREDKLVEHCWWHMGNPDVPEDGPLKRARLQCSSGALKRARLQCASGAGRGEDMAMPKDPLELSEQLVVEPVPEEGFDNGLQDPLQPEEEQPRLFCKEEPVSNLYDLDCDIDIKPNII